MALISSLQRKKTRGEKWIEIEPHVHQAEVENEFKDVEEENKRVVFGQLLRGILKELDGKSLLECARLVSKSWRNEATWILRNRFESCETTFKFHTGKTKFILFQSKILKQTQYQSDAYANQENKKREKGEEKDVSKLTEMLNSCPSHNFPCTNIHFEGGSLDCPQVLKFFAVYGKTVRKLTVDVQKNSLGIDGALRREIFKLTPKLESLELMDSNKWAPWNWDDLGLNDEVQVNPSTGQGQLAALKSLKFADSLDCFNRIQKLYKRIQPELPLTSNSNFSIFISTFEIPYTISDSELDSDLVFANIGHLIQPVNSVALQLCDRDPKTIRQLLKLVECRLKFKYIHVHSSHSETLSRMSSTDFTETGNALWKIVDGSREDLQNFICPVESFFLLTRQPFGPGFFHKLKTLFITFESDHGAQVTTRVSNPPLWKNLSEIAPSLENILLFFFDGDCLIESWLPFFDADAGQNITLKKFHVSWLGRRELLQKIILSFPFLTTLVLQINIIPPPNTMDSVQNLIRWLFVISLGIEHKQTTDENMPQNTVFFCPFKHLRFLEAMQLIFKNCGGIQQEDTRTASSAGQFASSVANACSLSKISGRKWSLIGDSEDCNSWRETSSDSHEKDDDESNNSDAAPSPVSKKVCIDMSCKQH